MNPIVVDPTIGSAIVGAFQTRRPDLPVVHPDEPAAVPTALGDADGPVAFLGRNSRWRNDYLPGLDAGDWVVTKTTGYENYPVEAFRDRGVAFSNTPGLTVEPIADHVVALVLTITRRIRTYTAQQADHVWEEQLDGMTDLEGDVCCIVGLGRIGETVAERARPFGMEVRGVKRSVEGYDGVAHEVFPAEQLHRALDGADVVVLSLPLTEETRGLVGEAELARCAADAIVVNVGRGPVLDTAALVDALEADRIRAAGIDVVDERPPPDDWPLWDREDVVVTPHVAGNSDKTDERLMDVLLGEYDRWVAGESPRHAVVEL